MDVAALEEVGFTASEAAVYEALIAIGTSTVGPLIERSGTASSKIYEILDKLIEKGLANYILVGKTKHYAPAHPQKLRQYLEERRRAVEEENARAQRLIPALTAAYEDGGKELHATIYKGQNGLETAFDEALDAMNVGEVLVTNVPHITPAEDRFFKHWNARRANKGVRLRMILDEEAKDQYQARENYASELRYLPKDVRTAAAINIFPDRIILFLPRDDAGDRLCVVVHGEAVVESFHLQFELQWASSQP